MTPPVRVTIVGAAGRMGTALLSCAAERDDLQIAAAVVHPDDAALEHEIGPQSLVATADLGAAVQNCDVVIDFSSPASCLEAARAASRANKAFVTGTTGLGADAAAELRELAGQIPVLHAANFSVGVNVLEKLVELASGAVGESFDLEVFEAHHRRKVDAPSGTALFLGRAAARARGHELEDVATWARHGHTGARTDDEIGFQVVRGGDIVGEHTVFMCGPGERLELTHRATDRRIFARGALRAAAWLAARPAGWYGMKDVLFGD